MLLSQISSWYVEGSSLWIKRNWAKKANKADHIKSDNPVIFMKKFLIILSALCINLFQLLYIEYIYISKFHFISLHIMAINDN